MKFSLNKLTVITAGVLATSYAHADERKFACYQDANECDVLSEMAEEFKAETGRTVNTEVVGHDIFKEQFESQLQTDAAPDLPRITNLGALNEYYFDFSPHVDARAWASQYRTQ